MGRRMSEDDWKWVAGLDVLDDTAAHMLAEEYAWGWSSCWFADTGQFDHNGQIANSLKSPAGLMDRALFGWWMDVEDDDYADPERKSPRVIKARELMRAYLTAREVCREMGPVEGFSRLWRAA